MTPGADLRRDVQEEDGRAMAGLFGGAGGGGRCGRAEGGQRGEGGSFLLCRSRSCEISEHATQRKSRERRFRNITRRYVMRRGITSAASPDTHRPALGDLQLFTVHRYITV